MLIRLSQNWPNDPFQNVILRNKEITSSNKENPSYPFRQHIIEL